MSVVSYSSFKNNISNFNSEEYLKNKIESDSFDLFLDFIQKYREIESEDLKKPIFSQTTKFKKNPNNFKHYKNLKVLRDKEKDEHKNIWSYQNPVEENTKIIVLIKSILNKICDDNYSQISTEFIDELLKINNNNLFQTISDEIFNKCIFESKYRNLYINLCIKIWSNRQIHYNLVNIINADNYYYWTYLNDSKKNGPFSNEINMKNDIYQKCNFKKFFLNYIYKLFINKDLVFDSLEEDEIYLKKKKLLLIVELISILYIEKQINFDIPNIIIIDLLHVNNFDKITEIEFELLYNLLKIIKDNKTNYNSLTDNNVIFNEYINIVQSIIENETSSKRSLFFMNEILSILKLFNNNKDTSVKNSSIKDNTINNKEQFINKLNNFNNSDIDIMNNMYKSLQQQDKNKVFYKIIDKYISDRKNNDSTISLIKNINDIDSFYETLELYTVNIKDILLDIPNANIKLIQLIEKLNYDKFKNNKYITIFNNISLDDSDTEGNSSSDSDSD
jgi:hypothetical protein